MVTKYDPLAYKGAPCACWLAGGCVRRRCCHVYGGIKCTCSRMRRMLAGCSWCLHTWWCLHACACLAPLLPSRALHRRFLPPLRCPAGMRLRFTKVRCTAASPPPAAASQALDAWLSGSGFFMHAASWPSCTPAFLPHPHRGRGTHALLSHALSNLPALPQGVNKAVILGLVDELLTRKEVNIWWGGRGLGCSWRALPAVRQLRFS